MLLEFLQTSGFSEVSTLTRFAGVDVIVTSDKFPPASDVINLKLVAIKIFFYQFAITETTPSARSFSFFETGKLWAKTVSLRSEKISRETAAP